MIASTEENILFHATFSAFIPSIKAHGLVPGGIGYKLWEDAEDGVYLSDDDNFAVSMTESTENANIPQEWFTQIAVLVIDLTKIDKRLLGKDPNVSWYPDYGKGITPQSFVYRGTIPPSAIKEIYDSSW